MSILTWQRKKLFRDFSWLHQQLVATSRWRRLVGGHGTLAQANIWYISSFKNRRGSWGQTSCVSPGSKGNRKRKRKHTCKEEGWKRTERQKADEFHLQHMKALRTESQHLLPSWLCAPLHGPGCAPFPLQARFTSNFRGCTEMRS